jgi:hypothetical protein
MNSDNVIKLPLTYNNELTKASGIVSHIFKRVANGTDLGILHKSLDIIADFNAEPTSMTDTDKHTYMQPLFSGGGNQNPTNENRPEASLRVAWNQTDAPTGCAQGDATKKFTVGHELGHFVQFLGASNWISLGDAYEITFVDHTASGAVRWKTNPPAVPDACRCFTTEAFNPAHCMQSLEWPNAAMIEGWAHYYASRIWNDANENDCWIPYVKWMYTPDCPDGDVCHDASDTDAYEKLFTDRDSKTQEYPDAIDGWQIVEAPVKVSCKNTAAHQFNWHKWRNEHCLGIPVPDSDGDGIPDYELTEDMKSLGVEMDWMKFFWDVNADDDLNRWTMNELLEIIGLAAANNSHDVTFDALLEQVDLKYGALSDKYDYFLKAGDKNGITSHP